VGDHAGLNAEFQGQRPRASAVLAVWLPSICRQSAEERPAAVHYRPGSPRIQGSETAALLAPAAVTQSARPTGGVGQGDRDRSA